MKQANSKPVYLRAPRRAGHAVTSRLRKRLKNALIAAGLVAAGSLPASLLAAVPAHAAGFDNAAAEFQLIDAINADRAANGQPALMTNTILSGIARSAPHSVCGGGTLNGRSQDMIERVFFSHQIPPCGSYVWPVLSAYGVQFSAAGENIGWNNVAPGASVAAVNDAFMLSAPHKANILGAYNQVGVGAFMSPGSWNGYTGVIMYTEIFSMGPAPAPVQGPLASRRVQRLPSSTAGFWVAAFGRNPSPLLGPRVSSLRLQVQPTSRKALTRRSGRATRVRWRSTSWRVSTAA